MDINRTGKLHDAAIEKARPTMNATFWFSKTMPRITATTPRTMVAIFETRISSCSLALPFFTTVAYKSWLMAEAPASVRPDTTAARMVAKATAEMKPRNRLPSPLR